MPLHEALVTDWIPGDLIDRFSAEWRTIHPTDPAAPSAWWDRLQAGGVTMQKQADHDAFRLVVPADSTLPAGLVVGVVEAIQALDVGRVANLIGRP